MNERVVLLHSGGMSSRQWRPLQRLLADGYSVLAPDLLGSGENPSLPEELPFSFDLELAPLRALLGDSPAHLVGHSYGALLALMLAVREPERVLSLALYEPPAFGALYEAGDAEGLAELAALEAHPTFADERTGGDENWMRIFIEYWNAPGAWDALPEQSRAAFLRVGRKVYREVRSIMADRTPLAHYQAVRTPTLLMSGGCSPLAERRVMKLLGQALPDATSLVFEDAGHMGPLTHGPAINDAIVAHLKKVIGQRVVLSASLMP